jgi:hypothetical protein
MRDSLRHGRVNCHTRAPGGSILSPSIHPLVADGRRFPNPRIPDRPMDFDDVRRVALALPGAEESTWFGKLTFKIRSKFFAGVAKDGVSLVVRCNVYARKYLMEAEPDVYHVTDHYRDDAYVLVHLSAIGAEALRERIEESWRMVAPKKLIADLDAGRASP